MCLCRVDFFLFLTKYACCYSDRLVSFLDDVAVLKLIDLIKIDYSSKEAICFFVNIYHTLLLHARLVLGIPNDEVNKLFYL